MDLAACTLNLQTSHQTRSSPGIMTSVAAALGSAGRLKVLVKICELVALHLPPDSVLEVTHSNVVHGRA